MDLSEFISMPPVTCIWQLKNAVYGSMFFEYKKAKNMHKVNGKLHISGLLIIFDIEEKRPLIE